jgi:hypothetical protein
MTAEEEELNTTGEELAHEFDRVFCWQLQLLVP